MFLNANTPEELRSAVANMRPDVAFADQLRAEREEAEQLAPTTKNRRLWSRVHGVATRAFAVEDFSETGIVPILRYNGIVSSTNVRHHDRPIETTIPIEYCALCGDGTAQRYTPFWVNAGPVIVQIDLCRSCALHAMDNLDAEPQIPLHDLLQPSL